MPKYTYQLKPGRKRVGVVAASQAEAKPLAAELAAERERAGDVPPGWSLDLSTIEGVPSDYE